MKRYLSMQVQLSTDFQLLLIPRIDQRAVCVDITYAPPAHRLFAIERRLTPPFFWILYPTSVIVADNGIFQVT